MGVAAAVQDQRAMLGGTVSSYGLQGCSDPIGAVVPSVLEFDQVGIRVVVVVHVRDVRMVGSV